VTSLPLAALTDLGRSKSELIAENALLRQQLTILKRQVKGPVCTKTDRLLLVLLARLVRTWQQAQITRATRHIAARAAGALSFELETPVQGLFPPAEGCRGKDNRLWGAERIRGELLKLGIHVYKRTVQKYMRGVRGHQPRGRKWSTFLHTHASQIWACDFLLVTDLFFRPLFAFFVIELHSRKVVHVGVTRSPTDAWVARTAARSDPVWASAEVSDS
jgi:putative transposase